MFVACDPGGSVKRRPLPAPDYLRDYIAIGDGLTAGVQSGALAKRQQLDSYPNLLARAFGIPSGSANQFEQPLIAAPGYPATLPLRPFGRLNLERLDPLVIAAVPWRDPSLATAPRRAEMHVAMELSKEYPRPFRNLGIPGAFAYDVVYAVDSLTTFTTTPGLRNFFVETVLRRGTFGSPSDSVSTLGHAKLATPGLATVWLGFSELEFAGSRGTGDVPYGASEFEGYVTTVVRTLADTLGARVLLADLPDLTAFPFYAEIPWYVTDETGGAVPHPITGEPIPILGEGQDTSDLQAGVTMVDEDARVLLSARAHLQRGAGIPDVVLVAWIRAADDVDEATAESLLPDRYPDHGRPLPASVTLTPLELRALRLYRTGYNMALEAVATELEIPLVRMSRVFRDLQDGVYSFAGVSLTGEFVTGGVFSLDGVYPTSLGYAAIANAWIEAINAAFDAGVSPIDLGDLVDPIEFPETGS
jgi:hypothetical protein